MTNIPSEDKLIGQFITSIQVLFNQLCLHCDDLFLPIQVSWEQNNEQQPIQHTTYTLSGMRPFKLQKLAHTAHKTKHKWTNILTEDLRNLSHLQ